MNKKELEKILNKLTKLMGKYGYKPYGNKEYWTEKSINFINEADYEIIIYPEKKTFKIELPQWVENNETGHIDIKMVYEIYNILKECK